MLRDSKRKISLITSEFPPNVGGIGNHAFNLALALQREGFSVTVVADIIDVADEFLETFTSKQPFKIIWIKRDKLILKTYLERISKSIRAVRSSEKIICSGKFSLWLALIIKVVFRAKELIAVVHGTELDLKSSLPKKVTSKALSKFQKIISVSKYTKQFLPSNLPDYVRIFVIHNGINQNEFIIKLSDPIEGNPSLITIGNLTERKGQENVIKALPAILKTYPSAKYHIVGKPSEKDKLVEIASKSGVLHTTVFYGAVDRNELLKKLGGASIKLMLSNHTADGDFEGFGIAVLEANAFGVPAIGSKNSGIADAIVDGKTGILVNQKDTEEISRAVETIMNNYSFFSANAKEWAMQHDWKIIVKEYVEAINE